MSDLNQASSGISGTDAISGAISFWRAYNEFCPNCGVEFSKLHPAANLSFHYYGECMKKKQWAERDTVSMASLYGPPKSPNQQILEAIAALADGIRSRDKQWDAVSEQQRIQYEAYMQILASFENRLMEALSYFTQFAAKETDKGRELAAIKQLQQNARRAKNRKR